jgi:1-deoxy-D-xylulose-5-phosphate synthase
VEVSEERNPLPIGKGEIIRAGKGIAILAFGSMLAPAMQAGDILDATVVNMRFIKPLDEDLIIELSEGHNVLVTIEENVIQGGAGSAVNEFLAERRIGVAVLNLGLPDRYIEHASPSQQLQICGLDVDGVVSSVRKFIGDLDSAKSVSG